VARTQGDGKEYKVEYGEVRGEEENFVATIILLADNSDRVF